MSVYKTAATSLVICFIFMGFPAWADEEVDYFESTREMVSNRVLRLSDQVDSLFGNTSYDDRSNTSTLRVEQKFYSKDGVLGADSPSTSLNLYLPNLKALEQQVKQRFFGAGSSGGDKEISEDEFNESNPWIWSQETGIVVSRPIDYFAKIRVRRDFLTGPFVHAFYEQIGWSKKNEWEEKSSLTSDYALSEDWLFRFINEKNWAMTFGDFGTTHGPSWIHQISDMHGISFDIRYQTHLYDDGLGTSRISSGVTYRGTTSLDWVYWSLNPEIAWEHETNFRALYNVYLTFSFIFGREKPEPL